MITEKISHFIAETRAEDIPQDAIELARLGITDFIGVTLAGLGEEQSQIIVDYARKTGGVPKATIIGSGFKTSPYLAALANGTLGHSLDYDDIAVSLVGHPSVFLVPSILAIVEDMNASGKDVLVAYVIGYEVASHIARPILQSHYTRGWHSTATFGTLGAAASVAWLLKLNAQQVRQTFGIAASLAGGLRQNFGTMTKPLHAGRAASNGVQAAFLAQAGFTADSSIIEAPLGFAKVFGHDEEVDWTDVGRSLGKDVTITSVGGLNIKPYPSCGFTHCAIDAALYVKDEGRLNAGNIAEVELGVSLFDKQVLIHHQPRTGLEGKFSLEYCVARALLSGEVRLRHFTDEAVTETQIERLIEKMKWVEKYPMPVMGTGGGVGGTKSVKVKLEDGREYGQEVTIAKGMPQNPLTPDEFNTKYRDCASASLGKKGVEKSLSILSNLQTLPNIRELIEIIA